MPSSFKLVRRYIVHCFKCKEVFNMDMGYTPVFVNKKEAKESLEDYGWTVIRDKAYCETCKPK
jgi:hypothetical protein